MTVRGGRRSQLHEVSPDSMGESGTFGFRLLVSPAAGKLRHLPGGCSARRGGETARVNR